MRQNRKDKAMKKRPYRVPIEQWNDPSIPMVQTPFYKFIMRNKEQCNTLVNAINAYFPCIDLNIQYLQNVSAYKYIFDHFWFNEHHGVNEQFNETHLN